MSYSSQLIIEEIDPPKGGSRGRSFTLMGSGLPEMGAEWGFENRMTTTWYAGNGDDATQQVLVPAELPSNWQGAWSLTMLIDTPAIYIDDTGGRTDIQNPHDLAEALETVLRQGMTLRVTWAVTSSTGDPSATGKIVRVGVCKTFKRTYDRLQDLKWSIEWAWRGRGIVPAKVSTTRANTVTTDGAAFRNKMNALIAASIEADLADLAPTALTLGQLEAIANYPSQVANSIARQITRIENTAGQVLDIAKTLASQPVQIANRAVALARDSVSQLNRFSDTMGQIPIEVQSTKQDLADLMHASQRFGTLSDTAQDAAEAGRVFAEQIQQQVQAAALQGEITPTRIGSPETVQQVHICKQGETPESISMLYYQTPDHAVDILRANRLPWHTSSFEVGKILIIPALQTNPGYIGA